jgi:hypothetical protein
MTLNCCSCSLSASSELREACRKGVGRSSCCHCTVPLLLLLPPLGRGGAVGRGISLRWAYGCLGNVAGAHKEQQGTWVQSAASKTARRLLALFNSEVRPS